MSRRLRTAALAGLLAVVGPLVVGCGGDDSVTVEASPQGLRQVAERTAEAGTGAFTLTMSMSGLEGAGAPAGFDSLEVTGEGVFDTDAKLARLSLDFGALFDTLTDQLGAGEVPPSVDLDAPIEMIVADTVIYMRGGVFALLGGDGDKWLKIDDPEALGESFGGSVGGAGFGSVTDPAALLGTLRGAGEVTEEGEVEIDGDDTTHFHVEIDLAKAVDEAAASDEEALQELADQMGDASVPGDIYVTDDGYVRRIEMTVDFADMDVAEVAGGTITMRIDFSGYGDDVNIDVPADDETIDGSSLFGG